MNKILFSAIACFFVFKVQAQVTKLPEGFTSGKTVWIVSAGVSLNGVSGDGVNATKDNWEKTKPNKKWSSNGDFNRALGDNLSIGLNKKNRFIPYILGNGVGGSHAWL